MNGYRGKEKRKNGVTITFDLKEYLEKEYLEKIKSVLPCSIHEEKMRGIKQQIAWIWGLVVAIIMGLISIGLMKK